MAIDPAGEISELKAKLASVEAVLEPDTMRKEADGLRVRAGDPGLWADQEQAQAITRRLSYLNGEIARLESLHRRLDDTSVMFELAESEDDEPTRVEAMRDLAALRKEVDQLEIRTLLSGEYDSREALISINAQAGGADAADWAEGLQRIYLRWAERHGYPTEIYDTSYAEEAGIKSTTFASTARTGWCGSPSTTTRAEGRPRSPGSTCCPWYSGPTTSTSVTTRSGWTSTGRAGRAARA